jgi:hypothetical protein
MQTNSEIAYVRQLDTSNMNAATGAVGCAFTAQTGKPVCPAASTILTAAEFLDNDTWLVRYTHHLKRHDDVLANRSLILNSSFHRKLSKRPWIL